MRDLQKVGGMAALFEALIYVVAFVVFFSVLDYTGVVGLAQKVAFLADNQTLLYVMNLLIYVIFGVFLVVLALALHERLKADAPAIAQLATAFGLIWSGLVIASGMVANIGTGVVVALYGTDPAQAGTVWLAIDAVIEGLGGGNEIVGGLWTLLVSWAALRAGALSRPLNSLGVAIGVAGVVSAVPALGAPGGLIFGLGQIVWFAWLGIVMLRDSPHASS